MGSSSQAHCRGNASATTWSSGCARPSSQAAANASSPRSSRAAATGPRTALPPPAAAGADRVPQRAGGPPHPCGTAGWPCLGRHPGQRAQRECLDQRVTDLLRQDKRFLIEPVAAPARPAPRRPPPGYPRCTRGPTDPRLPAPTSRPRRATTRPLEVTLEIGLVPEVVERRAYPTRRQARATRRGSLRQGHLPGGVSLLQAGEERRVRCRARASARRSWKVRASARLRSCKAIAPRSHRGDGRDGRQQQMLERGAAPARHLPQGCGRATPSFAEVAPEEPEPAQCPGQPQGYLRGPGRRRPAQGRAQVVVLGLEPVQPRHLLRPVSCGSASSASARKNRRALAASPPLRRSPPAAPARTPGSSPAS